MKPESVRTTLSTAVLSWLLAFSTVGCIATAFDFSLAQGLGNLAMVSGLFALAVAFAFRHFPLAAPVTLLLAAQMLVLFDLRQQPLQLYFLLPEMTRRYHNAYGWPILLDNPDGATQADLALLRLTLLVCFFLCWMLFRQKNLVLTLLPLSPVLCCVVVYDTVPAELLLCLFLLGLLLLLLTHRLRRQDAQKDWSGQGIRLLPAIALLLSVLLTVAPQTNQLNPLRSAANQLLPWIDGLFSDNLAGGGSSSGGVVGPSAANGVNLSTLGPKTQNDTVVLYVTHTKGGLTYLRQKSLPYYTGTAWFSIKGRTEIFGATATNPTGGTVTIRTVQALSYMYAPYFPDKALTFKEGSLRNASMKTTYAYGLRSDPTLKDYVPSAEIYTALPDATESWAVDLVEDLLGDAATIQEKVSILGAYVQNSATYSLGTARMPSYTTDFAKWFLEDSSTGYCVHFATAATVLLRAAGIPATYVEGLTVQTAPNVETPVTNSNAHAWVEYFDAETSQWLILDPTPADGIPDDPYVPGDPDDPDDPDTPDTPDTPDNPDVPDDPDEPIDPDFPVDPDDPDAPAQPDTPDLPNMTPDDYLPQIIAGYTPWVVAGAAAVLAVLQAILRRRMHRNRWNEGEHNARALERHRQCCRLAKVCKLSVPEALTDIAGKARFSQHPITEEELAQFDAFWQAADFAAKAAPLHRKLMRFFITAL